MQPCYSDLPALEKYLQMLSEFPTLSAQDRPKSVAKPLTPRQYQGPGKVSWNLQFNETKDDRKSWVRIPLSASKTGKDIGALIAGAGTLLRCSPRSYSRKTIPGEYRWQKVTLPWMEARVLEVVLKRFDNADEIREFEKGKFELINIGGMTIGRATYNAGWKWSVHVGKALGKKSCDVEHVGLVISGRAAVAMDDGRVIEMKAGDLFHISPGHDSWVIGDEPYVSLHLMGASDYASTKR